MKKLVSFLLAAAFCFASVSALADEPLTSSDPSETVSQTAPVSEEESEVVTSDTAPVGDEDPKLITSNTSPVKDPNAITVLINGTELVSDVPAQIINDRTMLPMRAIFERLGATVNWAEKDKAIFAFKASTMVVMRVNNADMLISDFVEGDRNVTLDVVPQIVNDRTLVPVRAVAEALGCEVAWDADTRTVTITD